MRSANRRLATAARSCEPLERRTLLSSWTALAHAAPAAIGTMELLTDGTIMAQLAGVTNNWYKLTPDANGDYSQGTWTTLANMSLQRLYTATNILQDGRVFVLGGEYSGPAGTANWTNTAEMYNPLTNTWTNIASHPDNNFGDDPTMLLPDGRILAGSLQTPATHIYNPTTNIWTTGGTKLNNDRSDEETWVKLRDDSVLSYNIFGSPRSAQRYVPSTNTWVPAGMSPVQLHTSAGAELGPALQLPDGRIVQIGGTPNNAIYNPTTNTWTALPVTPGNIGANDAPGALLPDGRIMYAAGDTSTSFNPPTSLFIMDAINNTVTAVNMTGGPSLSSIRPYNTRMLVLPDGKVLFTTSNSPTIWIYNPDGAPAESSRPTISSIRALDANLFRLSGSQLNGISCGASYGDDAEMDENYPIVRLTNAAGNVFYARSFNWNKTGIGTTNGATTVEFQLPAALATAGGAFKLEVIGAGIASRPVLFLLNGSATGTNLSLRADPATPGNVEALGGSNSLGSFFAAQFTQSIILGSNFINIASNAGIASNLVTRGFNLVVDATPDTAGANWQIDDTRCIRSGFGVTIDAAIDTLFLTAGQGSETIVVNLTGAMRASVSGGGNTDAIVVNSSGTGGPVVVRASAGNDIVHVNDDLTGTATAEVDTNISLGDLTINQGGTMLVRIPGGNGIVSCGPLVLNGNGTIDLADSDLLITPGNLAVTQTRINSARAGGTWTGSGITSSAARDNPFRNTTLGAMTGAQYLSVHGGTFDGLTVASNAVVVKYTWYGDTDFNGHVNFDDYVRADDGFNNHRTGWANGDFDGDGLVNFDDYVLIDLAFNTQSGTL